MIPVNQTRDIVVGSLLHDIGMIFIPKEILEKTTKLTEEERKTIQNHSEMGYCMIKDDNTISALAKLIVLCHHEREDGSGYPLGKGEDLHIGAKIVAACDVFVAITSERCYREGLSLNEAIILLRKEKLNENGITSGPYFVMGSNLIRKISKMKDNEAILTCITESLMANSGYQL